MAVLWWIGGVLLLAAGQWSVKKGIMSVAGAKPQLLTILTLVLAEVGLPVAAAAAAAGQYQSALLCMLLLAVGVYDVLLFQGVLGLIHPFEGKSIVATRECVMVFLVLCYLTVTGWDTFGTGNPDVWLGAKDGILFLILFAGEIFWLLVTSMNGYRLMKKEKSLTLLTGCLAGLTGICLAVGGGYLLAVSVEDISVVGGIHPALLGFFPVGLLLGAGSLIRGFKENKTGRTRTMSALWGAPSLALSGGLAAACLMGPVCLSFPVALLALIGCAALAVYEIWVQLRGQVDRGLSLFLLFIYAAAGAAVVLILR